MPKNVTKSKVKLHASTTLKRSKLLGKTQIKETTQKCNINHEEKLTCSLGRAKHNNSCCSTQ